MMSGRLLLSAFAFAVALAALPSLAQQYPTRAVRIVVGFAPGGSADVLSALYEELAKITRRTDMQEQFRALSINAGVRPPAQYTEFIKAETSRWVPIIKASAARVE